MGCVQPVRRPERRPGGTVSDRRFRDWRRWASARRTRPRLEASATTMKPGAKGPALSSPRWRSYIVVSTEMAPSATPAEIVSLPGDGHQCGGAADRHAIQCCSPTPTLKQPAVNSKHRSTESMQPRSPAENVGKSYGASWPAATEAGGGSLVILLHRGSLFQRRMIADQPGRRRRSGGCGNVSHPADQRDRQGIDEAAVRRFANASTGGFVADHW